MSLQNPCNFLLTKESTWKCIFNTNSELSQNRTVKQIMLFKTTFNWLFNNIWYYLVIGSFDWKIISFLWATVRGLLYPLYLFRSGRTFIKKHWNASRSNNTILNIKKYIFRSIRTNFHGFCKKYTYFELKIFITLIIMKNIFDGY